ncbi:MAG: ParA family protein [Candidatus Komeilibacteria bacterium]
MTRIISIVNQKGGVGKTTTAINLSAYLAKLDQRVLLIDVDPQGNASSGLGINTSDLLSSLYEVLVDDLYHLDNIIKPTQVDGLHIAPAQQSLAGANIDLVSVPRREYKLWEKISKISPQYDFVIIDNPPSLGLLTINGLVAADEILIPVQTEYYALEGLSQLLHTINLVIDNLKPDLKILGAVMTMYDNRSKLSEAVFYELYKFFPNKIFRSIIPRNIKLAEAPSHGKPILMHDHRSRGARAYAKLAQEILDAKRYH